MSRPLRLALPVLLLAVGLTTVSAATAGTGTWTKVTTPSGSVVRPWRNFSFGAQTMNVSGTTSHDLLPGSDTVSIVCSDTADTHVITMSSARTIQSDWTFAGQMNVPFSQSDCTLRAVPSTYTGIDNTGHNSGYLGAFTGPRYYGGGYATGSSGVAVITTGTRAAVRLTTPGNLGLDVLQPVNDAAQALGLLAERPSLALFPANVVKTGGTSTRSAIRVDNQDAFTPYTTGGSPGATEKVTRGAAGMVTVREVDPLRRCDGNTTFPPTACTVVPLGVHLVRTYVTSVGGAVVRVEDRFVSTDNHVHTINLEYDAALFGEASGAPAFLLPGHASWSHPAEGTTTKLAAGVRTMLTTNDRDGADGDISHVVEGTTYTAPPTVFFGADGSTLFQFGLRYVRRAYPGRPAVFTFAFETTFAKSATDTLAQSQAKALRPHLTVRSPKRGASTRDHTPTIKGTLANAVNGLPARVTITIGDRSRTARLSSTGAFSLTWTALSKGRHTLKIAATDPGGLRVGWTSRFAVT
jgi:hypothetical protein